MKDDEILDAIGDPSPLIHAFILVNLFFKKDDDKTLLWFTSKNPHFGNVAPLELFKRGRGHKVLAFIEGTDAMREMQ